MAVTKTRSNCCIVDIQFRVSSQCGQLLDLTYIFPFTSCHPDWCNTREVRWERTNSQRGEKQNKTNQKKGKIKLQKRRRSLPWILSPPPTAASAFAKLSRLSKRLGLIFVICLTQQILALSTVFKNIEKATKQDIFVSALRI